jgi:signal transduction histidine kinase
MTFDREHSLEGIISLTPRLLVGTTITQLDEDYLQKSFEKILIQCKSFLGFKGSESFLIRDSNYNLKPASRNRDEELYEDFIASVGYQESEVQYGSEVYPLWRQNKQNLNIDQVDPAYYALRHKKPVQLYWNPDYIQRLESEGIIIPGYTDHRKRKYEEYLSHLRPDEQPIRFEDWARFTIFPLLTEINGVHESVGYMTFEHAVGIDGNEPIPEEQMEIAQLTVNSAMLPITVSVFAEEIRNSRDRLITAEKEALLKQILFGAVHDIKNVLAPVENRYVILQGDLAKFEEYLRAGETDTVKLQNLYERIERSRRALESGHRQLRKARAWVGSLGGIDQQKQLKKLTLESLLQESLSLHSAELEGVTMGLNYEKQPYYIMGVEHEISTSILPNLIRNSLEAFLVHRTPNPQILLTTKFNLDNTADLTFEDNGPGINPDLQRRIFDPYTTTKEDLEGRKRGLGLHQVKQMMESIGGSIFVESKTEQPSYTRFTLKFLSTSS